MYFIFLEGWPHYCLSSNYLSFSIRMVVKSRRSTSILLFPPQSSFKAVGQNYWMMSTRHFSCYGPRSDNALTNPDFYAQGTQSYSVLISSCFFDWVLMAYSLGGDGLASLQKRTQGRQLLTIFLKCFSNLSAKLQIHQIDKREEYRIALIVDFAVVPNELYVVKGFFGCTILTFPKFAMHSAEIHRLLNKIQIIQQTHIYVSGNSLPMYLHVQYLCKIILIPCQSTGFLNQRESLLSWRDCQMVFTLVNTSLVRVVDVRGWRDDCIIIIIIGGYHFCINFMQNISLNNKKSAYTSHLTIDLLTFLAEEMTPADKPYDIVQIMQIIQKYIERYKFKEMSDQRLKDKNSTDIRSSNSHKDISKSQNNKHTIRQQISTTQQSSQSQSFQILNSFKQIFLYYGQSTLSLSNVNDFIFNQQLTNLSSSDLKDEQYMETGSQRIRLDENIKLCIMPMREDQQGGQSQESRIIKEVIVRENIGKKGKTEDIYVITRDYVREVDIRPQLIGNGASFQREGQEDTCWYRYADARVKPKKSTLKVQAGQRDKALSFNELKLQKEKESKESLSDLLPATSLTIRKASLGGAVLGMISHDYTFSLQPISRKSDKTHQGYVGNLNRDLPKDAPRQPPGQILFFQNWNDHEWIIITTKWMYVYRIPSPSENVSINDQNNQSNNQSSNQSNNQSNQQSNNHNYNQSKGERRRNRLLILCQPMLQGCTAALLLTKPYLALMLDSKAIVIINLQLKSIQIPPASASPTPYLNHYTITNKIFNDVRYTRMCFHQEGQFLFMGDFGGYLMRIKLNEKYGDIQEEGVVYDSKKAQQLSGQMRSIIPGVQRNNSNVCITLPTERTLVYNMPHMPKAPSSTYLSMYAKQSSSPSTMVVHNHTRQIISYLATNSHYSTLITLESQPFEKNVMGEVEGEKYKEWGHKNTIKLWDIHHMSVYQYFIISVQTKWMSLLSNGLYVVTQDKGFLGYYPFNQSKLISSSQKQLNSQKQGQYTITQLNDQIMSESNNIFFAANSQKYNKFNNSKQKVTRLFSLDLKSTPSVTLLKEIPTQITNIAVSNRVYILEPSLPGLSACSLHIYNKLGVKQQVMAFSNAAEVDVMTGINHQLSYDQEFKNIKKIVHQQFQVILWNREAFKCIGSNSQESLTIKWTKTQDASNYGTFIKEIDVCGKFIVVLSQNIQKYTGKALSSITSKSKASTDRKVKQGSKVKGQISSRTIILINSQTDRITHRIHHIPSSFKILYIFSNLIISKQQDATNRAFDIITVMDLGVAGDLTEKLLFAMKFRKNITQKEKASENEGFQMKDDKNIIIQGLKLFLIKKSISVQQARITITDDNKMLLLVLFKVQTVVLDNLTNNYIKSFLTFTLYSRNITDELLNRNYKINKLSIGRFAKKNAIEYHTHTGRSEKIIDHKIITYEGLTSISNCGQIQMGETLDYDQIVAKKMEHFDKNQKKQFLDISSQIAILRGKSANQNQMVQRISINDQHNLIQKINATNNFQQSLSSFTAKMLDFDEQQISGVISISSKQLKSLSIYTFEVMIRKIHQKVIWSTELMQHTKFSLFLSKLAHIQIFQEQERHDRYGMNGVAPCRVEILEWNRQYKKSTKRLWQETYESLRQYIDQGAMKRKESKIDIQEELSDKFEKYDQGNKDALTKGETKVLKFEKSAKLNTTTKQEKIEQKQVDPDAFSKQFKKWSISQAIEIQRKKDEQMKQKQLKSINKYISKILKNDTERQTRINQLIQNTKQIKEIRSSSQRSHNRQSRSPDSRQPIELKTIYESSLVAQNASLRNYLLNQNDNFQTSSNTYEKGNNIRHTEISSINQTLLSQSIMKKSKIAKTNKSGTATAMKASNVENGLENKLIQKLNTIQSKDNAENSLHLTKISNFQFKNQRKAMNPQSPTYKRSKTSISQYLEFTPILSPIRIRTDQKSDTPDQKTIPFTKKKDIKSNRYQDYTYPRIDEIVPSKHDHSTRVRTELSTDHSIAAISQIKKSEIVMKDLVLPEIKKNKEKIIVKMKSKKSFLSQINTHLRESNIMVLRDEHQRQRIISKLYNYQ